PRVHRRAHVAGRRARRPCAPADLLPGPQLRPVVHKTRLPLRLERPRALPRPPPGPPRTGPATPSRLAPQGRPVVRQPPHDADAARPFRITAGRPGAPGRDRKGTAHDRGGVVLDHLMRDIRGVWDARWLPRPATA